MRLLPLLGFCGLIACAEFPVLDGTIAPSAQAAPYPALTPLGPLLARADQLGQGDGASGTATRARAASLRARAARLRGPIIDAATRARMRRGIDTGALR